MLPLQLDLLAFMNLENIFGTELVYVKISQICKDFMNETQCFQLAHIKHEPEPLIIFKLTNSCSTSDSK